MYNFFLIVHNKSNKINAFYKKNADFSEKTAKSADFSTRKTKNVLHL